MDHHAFPRTRQLAVRALAALALGTALATGVAGAADHARRASPLAVSLPPSNPIALTPLVWSVVAEPVVAVQATDGRMHLAYELMVTNVSSNAVRIHAIEFVDPQRDNRVVARNDVVDIVNADVSQVVKRLADPPQNTTMTRADYTDRIEPGRSGLLYVDLTFTDAASVPATLAHRFTLSSIDAARSAPAASDPLPESSIGALLTVDTRRPISLGPPLRGAGWLDGSGCCRIIGPHRYTVLPIAGALRPSEHFAIDFVQLDAQGRVFTGDPKVLRNWPFYGADIIAAGAGRVVQVRDGLPDQEPGQLPSGITADTAAGNHVIVDMGQGRFALYAHLIPGSIVVREGQQVARGELLGRLGNSGNSDAPHLHFHVMTSASALDTVGLPFVFERVRLQGTAIGTLDQINERLLSGGSVQIDTSRAGARRDQMPLTLDVLDFQ